ncbi:MAG: cytochrome c [Vicinamibacterales bacterium]
MKTVVLAATCVLAALAWNAPSVVGQARKPAQAPKGPTVKELYGSMCQACHGPDGKAPIKEMGFVGRKWKTKTVAEAAKTIREGVPGTAMLPFEGRLTAPQIAALAKHVRALDTTAKRPKKK